MYAISCIDITTGTSTPTGINGSGDKNTSGFILFTVSGKV